MVLAGGAIGAGALLLRSSGPTSAAGAPRFVSDTATSGISHRYEGDVTFAVGGGVAVLDCNADGRPDLYLAGGSAPATLYRNDGAIGGPLHFSTVDAPAVGLPRVTGAYPIDIDGDGITDLVVLRAGESAIFRGTGNCQFEPVSEALGFDGAPGDTFAFSATWEGAAALPTLAFGRYLRPGPDGTPTADCDSSSLLRPAAGGARYGSAIDLLPGYCALSMLFSDWDRSGRRDLRVTNDRNYYADGMDQLWRVEPGRAPRLYTAEDGWVAMQIFGMGIASQDLTGVGYPELYITSQGDNKLQTLTSGPDRPTYRDIALRRGVIATQPFTGGDTLPSTAWHPEFQDVNNDGFLDLFVSKGNVSDEPGYAIRDPSNLFLGQPDGTFVEGAEQAGIVTFERGRGAALADFNLDGLPDLVVANYGADVSLWRNVGSGTEEAPAQMGNWAAIRLLQARPNPDAIGAWIETRIGDQTLQRELSIGGGHAGGQLGWLHLGLGPAGSAEVRVQWPDGELGPWIRVEASEFAIIERGATEARRWLPGGS
ncbi:MAG: VCBS repeat-containing protein [Chloroflexi bacterium]|nr:VCBS repeat-containing protein [Chloroflexota bacterium]